MIFQNFHMKDYKFLLTSSSNNTLNLKIKLKLKFKIKSMKVNRDITQSFLTRGVGGNSCHKFHNMQLFAEHFEWGGEGGGGGFQGTKGIGVNVSCTFSALMSEVCLQHSPSGKNSICSSTALAYVVEPAPNKVYD